MSIKEDNNFIYDMPINKNFKYYYRKFITLPLKDIVLIFLLKFYRIKGEKISKKYYVSICAIFKDEGIYLKEWLEYHMMIGIEHFYLYNNFSSDNYLEVLKPYIDARIVTLREWPVNQGQLSAYKDCYEKSKNESQWIGFIDIDEFICPYKTEDIKLWLKNFEIFPSIILYWKMFGASGKIQREKELVLEEFYLAYEKPLNIGKAFFNTAFLLKKHNVHSIISEMNILGMKIKLYSWNEHKKYLQYNIHRKAKNNFTIQLNHYYTKTYKEYVEKKIKRGDVYFKVNSHKLEAFYEVELKSTICDFKIFRFLIELKNILNKNK